MSQPSTEPEMPKLLESLLMRILWSIPCKRFFCHFLRLIGDIVTLCMKAPSEEISGKVHSVAYNVVADNAGLSIFILLAVVASKICEIH